MEAGALGQAPKQAGEKQGCYSCSVRTLHEAPTERVSEAEMEPVLHAQNCIPGQGFLCPEEEPPLTEARALAQEGSWSELETARPTTAP